MDDTEHKKRCPYCHEEMAPGLLHGGGGKAITWLPEDLYPRDLGGGFLAVTMAKKIVEAGGFDLDGVLPLSAVAKEKPVCYYCEGCRILLTQLDERVKYQWI